MSRERTKSFGGRGRVASTLTVAALVALATSARAASIRSGHQGRHAHAAQRAQTAQPAHTDRRSHAHRRGHAAHTMSGTDTAHLHLVHQNEAQLYEVGAATGALRGRMTAWLTIGSMFKGKCTIHTSHGSITGRGVAKPHGLGRYQSFSGTFYVRSGSGAYKHVHGRMKLYGTFDRRTFAVVVHTHGRLSY